MHAVIVSPSTNTCPAMTARDFVGWPTTSSSGTRHFSTVSPSDLLPHADRCRRHRTPDRRTVRDLGLIESALARPRTNLFGDGCVRRRLGEGSGAVALVRRQPPVRRRQQAHGLGDVDHVPEGQRVISDLEVDQDAAYDLVIAVASASLTTSPRSPSGCANLRLTGRVRTGTRLPEIRRAPMSRSACRCRLPGMTNNGTVLVAGASGVFGRHIDRVLTDAGYTVLGLGRGSSNALRADLNDRDQLLAAVAGAPCRRRRTRGDRAGQAADAGSATWTPPTRCGPWACATWWRRPRSSEPAS